MRDLDQNCIRERLEIIDELGQERLAWMSQRAISGFANTERIDVLLQDLFDLDRVRH